MQIKKQLRAATIFLLLSSSVFVQKAYSHPAIPLKDINGNSIVLTDNCVVKNGVEFCEGNPVSWEATCGACHKEITGNVLSGVKKPGYIHSSYHVGRGWDEMKDSFGEERVNKGEDWRKFLRSLGDDGAW